MGTRNKIWKQTAATEGIFSAVKGKFSENLVGRKRESLINEATQRF